MKISVVTVVLNDGVGLKKTADNLLEQTCSDFQWIIIDGGSSDGGLELIKNSILLLNPVVISEPDMGIYDAMNKGVTASRGDFVVFMNAGDSFSHDSVIKELLLFIDRHYPLDVVLGGTYQNIQSCIFYRPPKNIRWILHGLPSFHQSIAFRTSLLKAHPYHLDYPLLSDYEWLARRCVRGVRVGYFNHPVSNYHVGGASYTNLWQKFQDAYVVKVKVLGLSPIRSFVSSGFAIVKTMLVMYVLYKMCPYKTLSKLTSKRLVDIEAEFYRMDEK